LCLALLALTGTAAGMSVRAHREGSSSAHYCSRESLGSAPSYLIAAGPSGFRFAPPPPVATERPIVAPVAVVASPVQNEPVATAPVVSTAPAPTTEKSVKSSSNTSKPALLIPDDTPSEVHPEDILPYFKLPRGEKGSVDVPFTPASPNTLPKSSATYEMQ